MWIWEIGQVLLAGYLSLCLPAKPDGGSLLRESGELEAMSPPLADAARRDFADFSAGREGRIRLAEKSLGARARLLLEFRERCQVVSCAIVSNRASIVQEESPRWAQWHRESHLACMRSGTNILLSAQSSMDAEALLRGLAAYRYTSNGRSAGGVSFVYAFRMEGGRPVLVRCFSRSAGFRFMNERLDRRVRAAKRAYSTVAALMQVLLKSVVRHCCGLGFVMN